MCGLCGVYGIIGKKEKQAFGILSMISQLRGKDSTGVGLIYSNKKRPAVVAKCVGGQETLANEYPKLFDVVSWELLDYNLCCVIGHNRWATVGKVTEENAHPFHEEHVVGCHNGTIPLHKMSHLDSHNWKLSDSQILIKELADNNNNAADVVKHLIGAWAIVWFDTKRRQLHMCRNKERTLHVATAKTTKTMFWASEGWMLMLALGRAGIDHGGISIVKENKHLVWKLKGDNTIILKDVFDAIGGKVKEEDNWWGINRWIGKTNVYPLKDNKREETEEEYEEEYTQTYEQRFVHRRRFENSKVRVLYPHIIVPLLF